jgi:hypothetical protein
MNAIDVPVAFVALSEKRSRSWLSLLLFFRAIFFAVILLSLSLIRTKLVLFRHCLSQSQESIEGGTIHQFATDNDGAYALSVVACEIAVTKLRQRIKLDKANVRIIGRLDCLVMLRS